MDVDNPLASLQVASCIYRIALGSRAGQQVLSLCTVPGRIEKESKGAGLKKIEAPHAGEAPFLYRITCRGA